MTSTLIKRYLIHHNITFDNHNKLDRNTFTKEHCRVNDPFLVKTEQMLNGFKKTSKIYTQIFDVD